jgi:hypothetical protein
MIDEEMLSEAIRERDTVKTMSALLFNGGKIRTWIPDTKPSDVIVGKRFWRQNEETWKWEQIRITYVRSGVAFFVLKGKRKEDIIFLHEFNTKRLYPLSYESDLDPTQYEEVCRCKMTKITYNAK